MEIVQLYNRSEWLSKINWTQVIAMGSTLAVIWGVPIPPETQVAVVATIQGVQTVATWVLKTWFTTTVTPAAETVMGVKQVTID